MGADDYNKAKENLCSRRSAEKLEEIIFSEELIEGKYEVDKAKKANYEKALRLIRKFSDAFSYEASDPDKPYYYHSINIKFNFDDDNWEYTFPGREIGEVIELFDDFLVTENDGAGQWQLGSQIYTALS